MSLLFRRLGRGTSHPRPAPVNQGPLPPFNTSGNPATTLPPNQIALPNRYDPLWWRGNAWSVTIPGLPWIPGFTSSLQPERCCTWFLGASPWTEWVDPILTAHSERGYTHFTLGLSDNLKGLGLTLQQYVDLSAYVRSWGFDVHHQLGSKDFDPADQTWAGYWQGYLTPALQQLAAVDAIQHGSIWEANTFNLPGDPFQDILVGIKSLLPPSAHEWVHFSPGVTWWGAGGDIDNRFTWWDKQQGILAGLLYQTNCWAWDNGMRQARIQDTTTRDQNFINGVFKFVAWENDAACGFDNPQPDEANSAADSYVLLCTPGGCAVSGFGNGCWLTDGTPTFNGTF